MIISFCNQKGGVGKTTLSVLVALALTEVNRRVSIWDRDPQGSARTSLEGSAVAPWPEPADITIIDTPPTLSGEFDDAVRIADRVILVASPYPVDLWATKATAQQIKQVRGGAKGKATLLFNRVRRGTAFGDQDLGAIAKQVGLPCYKSTISLREAYAQTHVVGWKALSAQQREEVFSAALEIVT
jgi:chromosome partitioning protein